MNGPPKSIGILIVEDSPTVRAFLTQALGAVPGFRVVGTAQDGESALKMLERERPDIITMDVNLPGIDGFETTRRIMETRPRPIVMVSGSIDAREVANGFRALEAGALALLPRPHGFGASEHQAEMQELVSTLKAMSEVKVIRRWPRLRRHAGPASVPRAPADAVKLVAIGSSTGGPMALKIILSGLPRTFPAPILIVQHMAEGFMEGFGEWLGQASGFPVRVASHGEAPLPGRAYLAPHGMHMTVGHGNRILLNAEPDENGTRPSVSQLFRSISERCPADSIGVLLTGMGKDGAAELRSMREGGAITIAQDKASSVVHGMPGEAIRLEAADHVLALEDIAAELERMVLRR